MTLARAAWPLGLLPLWVAAGCGATAPSPVTEVPDETALTRAVDLDPRPDVVEIRLVAREAEKTFGASPPTRVWAYDGAVPGPLIEANVGDRLIVHFENRLPEATTIHWHGVRLPAAMDGTMAMQRAIPPGGTFDYEFTLKDPGLYWFHPHVRSDIQVQRGLYGAIRVRGPSEPLSDDERVLVLDDVRLKPDGSLAEYLDDMAKMMGREGNTLLVNGRVMPTLRFRPGARVRLRLVNAANGRFFNLRLPGSRWLVLGTDGGTFRRPYEAEQLLVAPGERYDVMFVAGPAGEVTLTNDPYDRGHESGSAPAMPLATIRAEGEPLAGKPAPAGFAGDTPLPAQPVDFPLVLDEKPSGDTFVFTINGAVYPDVPALRVKSGEIKVLGVENASEMAHPFHLHGFFFQILSTNGVKTPLDRLVNKDTVVIPGKTSLELVARFDEPGHWMYHCHILEHAEAGMMGAVVVE